MKKTHENSAVEDLTSQFALNTNFQQVLTKMMTRTGVIRSVMVERVMMITVTKPTETKIAKIKMAKIIPKL